MCGLAGFLLDVPRPIDAMERQLWTMGDMLAHRGPDHSAVWTDGSVGFSHRRLSIIDRSPSGHQPMVDRSARFRVMCNGEIYNFRELRRELEGVGHVFRGKSDTEVIAEGYAAWGVGLFERLDGMFAIAVWDGPARKLVLARDPFGKKPLSYAITPGAFLFGSEAKAILAWPGFERRVDMEAVHHYLSFQYVPQPWSAFAGIRKVPPGHVMVFESGLLPKAQAYYRLPTPADARKRSEADLISEIRHCLAESVRRRLVSDVPVGAFLSGGIDSSTVVALMAQSGVAPIRTFSIGFERQDFDERPFARLVAARFDTDHREFLVKADATAVLPKLAWHYGEPFADSSAIPTFLVSQMAREYVGVALNGDGGDEAFLGYDSYGRYWRCRWIEKIPTGLRRAISRRAERVDVWNDSSRLRRGLAWRAADLDERGSRRHARFMAYFGDGDKAAAYGPVLRPFLRSSSLDLWEPWFAQAPDMPSGSAWCDIHTYLPDGLLVKVDIASMAHGLEVRSPFLDRAVMALAATIPADQKFAGGVQKGLLRRAVADLLPASIVSRPKRGFGVPIQQWLAEDIHAFARDMLLSTVARERGLFEPRAIERMLDEHRLGRRLHHTRLWAALCLELWWRMWIDSPVVPNHS